MALHDNGIEHLQAEINWQLLFPGYLQIDFSSFKYGKLQVQYIISLFKNSNMHVIINAIYELSTLHFPDQTWSSPECWNLK